MLSEHQTKPDQTDIAVTGLEATAAPVGDVAGKLTCKKHSVLDLQPLGHSLLPKNEYDNRIKSLTRVTIAFPTILQNHARQRLMEGIAQLST